MGGIYRNDEVGNQLNKGQTSFIDEEKFNLNAGYLAHFYKCQVDWVSLELEGDMVADEKEIFKRKHKILKLMHTLLFGKFSVSGKYKNKLEELKKDITSIDQQRRTLFRDYSESNAYIDKRLIDHLDNNYDDVFARVLALLEDDGMLTKKTPEAMFAMGDMS